MFNSFPVMFNSFHVIFTSSPVISILSLLFQFLPCYFNSSLDIFTVVCLSAGLKVTGGKMTRHGYLGAFITKVKKGSIADTVGHLHAGKYDPTELGRNCSGNITHLWETIDGDSIGYYYYYWPSRFIVYEWRVGYFETEPPSGICFRLKNVSLDMENCTLILTAVTLM